jgi:hypothetical protein
MNVKDWLSSIPKVHQAVRITILPPWKIRDVPNHAAVNLGTLGFVAILYLLVRAFTLPGAYGLTEAGVVTLFTSIFLLLCGIAVNFFDPTVNAVKLSNRWSTFLIVNFMFSIFLLIVVFAAVPLITGRNLIDFLADFLPGGNASAYLAVTLIGSGFSISLLYWRTRRWFHQILVNTPQYFYVSMVACAVINWMVLFATVYVI